MNNERILIPIPALFSFDECLWFLNRNYDDCLHVIKGNAIFKTLEIGGEVILIRIREKAAFLEVTILQGRASAENKAYLTDYVFEWFDMRHSIQPFYDLLIADGRFAYMTEAYKGLRLIGISNLFEAICWCIIGQQINLSFAYKLKRRLVERFGIETEQDGDVYHVFPAAEILSAANVDELKAIQFSQKKAEYIIGIANAFANGALSKKFLLDLPDFDSRKKALTDHKGIGIWTANYVLMKCLREPGGIPHGDVGLLNALSNHDIIKDRGEAGKIQALFDQYQGWESYLVFYLWRSLAVKDLA
ncbi:DNA-3-methyladenine glycosylase family protein [Dyadobacter arcticus]|uniref:DNA-3-methyladenine glycosylase II n=1 Tax=Dyadobacter arcticus TaxID=1078754 RepID=A0ABX0UMD0_9BACT|nr:DNA-3-methyladenine glycosylase 2 family protein [Dyadobacter arcticus]NIJ54116.1 DNA-3-methyladenine glycosylase II [Dyadobacter arcticus]